MPTRILLVDDSALIRRALRTYIDSETDWEVCGGAENGKVAIDLVQRLLPDVIVLDLSVPVMNGLDAARHIRNISPSAGILLFTLQEYPQLLEDARRVGVSQVLSKSGGATEVLSAVRSFRAA
jgi:two-component system, NarL family, nitrate/nitrite response regulator NarL